MVGFAIQRPVQFNHIFRKENRSGLQVKLNAQRLELRRNEQKASTEEGRVSGAKQAS